MTISKDGEHVADEAYESRRLGRFDISEIFYQVDFDTVSKVFECVVPIDVSFDYSSKNFMIKGFSKLFDAVPLGQMLPYYQVIINKNPETGETMVSFKKT